MRGGSGALGGRTSILGISSSCPSGGGVLISHLEVAASFAVIEVSFSFLMVSCYKSL